jgi:hypothetical protein
MSQQTHLSELERKHRALDNEISSARANPSSDSLQLAELKRRKLQLKDEIASLKAKIEGKTVH